MTSKEFHFTKVVPARRELFKLEAQWEDLRRDEDSAKIGTLARCCNCMNSCVIDTGNYVNSCIKGKDIDAIDWCYRWKPENKISKFLRENFPYNTHLVDRLENIFGTCFIEECNNQKKEELVLKMVEMIKEFEE